jgi:hypothetical protein
MPWELGYMDAWKNGRAAICPVVKAQSWAFVGQEYLGLYPFVNTYMNVLWIDKQGGGTCTFKDWLAGRNPSPR